jgi:uncharacterized protein YdiU (UPF0061 family)
MTGSSAANPLLALPFEASIEGLGGDYWDEVDAAAFPTTQLRFRNDDLLHQLGLDSAAISDAHFEAAYGRFVGRAPLLALRYHGYQFGSYNQFLGDGRGFLYGQLRDRHGQLQDLGTKGSGTTPWSRGGDGRLTLKGGVREIIASEALHRLGVTTSRSLSLIETGEALWRGDEPSPTRSAGGCAWPAPTCALAAASACSTAANPASWSDCCAMWWQIITPTSRRPRAPRQPSCWPSMANWWNGWPG